MSFRRLCCKNAKRQSPSAIGSLKRRPKFWGSVIWLSRLRSRQSFRPVEFLLRGRMRNHVLKRRDQQLAYFVLRLVVAERRRNLDQPRIMLQPERHVDGIGFLGIHQRLGETPFTASSSPTSAASAMPASTCKAAESGCPAAGP